MKAHTRALILDLGENEAMATTPRTGHTTDTVAPGAGAAEFSSDELLAAVAVAAAVDDGDDGDGMTEVMVEDMIQGWRRSRALTPASSNTMAQAVACVVEEGRMRSCGEDVGDEKRRAGRSGGSDRPMTRCRSEFRRK